MPSILVTGGTDFIGSHACIPLINAGCQITILDQLVHTRTHFYVCGLTKQLARLNYWDRVIFYVDKPE